MSEQSDEQVTREAFSGAGTYRNSIGVVMVVEEYAPSGTLLPHVQHLGSIWRAQSPDAFFGPTWYLVTPEGMEQCGYQRVRPGGDSDA